MSFIKSIKAMPPALLALMLLSAGAAAMYGLAMQITGDATVTAGQNQGVICSWTNLALDAGVNYTDSCIIDMPTAQPLLLSLSNLQATSTDPGCTYEPGEDIKFYMNFVSNLETAPWEEIYAGMANPPGGTLIVGTNTIYFKIAPSKYACPLDVSSFVIDGQIG